MPRRPREHQIEDESRRAFEAALPSRFVYRPFSPDYGLDGEVEEFDEDELATGLRFYVQLKATDQLKLGKALKVSLPLEHADYYRSLPLPVLMVRFHSPIETLYSRWFHQFDPYYGGVGEQSLTFRWEEGDLWNEDRPAELVEDVQAFLALRSSAAPLPYPFYVDVTEEAHGLSPAQAALAIRGTAARRPDIVQIAGQPARDGARIEFTAELLRVSIATVNAATLHLGDDYDPGENGEHLAHDVFVLAALAYEQIGQAGAASRLTETFLPGASIPLTPDIAHGLSGAMFRAGRVREACELAETLDCSANAERRAGSVFFTFPALAAGAALSPAEVATYRQMMAGRISRRIAAGERIEAALDCVSLGNHCRNRGDVEEALPLYEQALELDPGYADRSHYWHELAGVLFGSRRYAEAAEAYGSARALGADHPFLPALHADALMHAGNFVEARELFAASQTDSRARAGEWRLKSKVLDHIVDRLGIDRQERQPEEAARRAAPANLPGTAVDDHTALVAALKLDALSELAWFNLAHANLQLGRRDEVLLCYLVAALLNERDPESWARAYWFSVEGGEAEVAVDIVLTAYRFCGTEFSNEASRFARGQGADFPADPFLAFIDGILSEQAPDEEEAGFTLRFINDDGDVESVRMHP